MANGRLGFKCIPPYSSCEVYQNSSGAEASVSIGAQGLNSSVNNTISVAAGTTSYTLVCAQNEAVGTNCFKDTTAITVSGAGRTDPHGAWIQSSTAIGGTVSTRPTSFMNVDGTRTSIAGTALREPAAYGGSEFVLPATGMVDDFKLISNGSKIPYSEAFMFMDCHGVQPLKIDARNYNCCYEWAGAMMINPQCDCRSADYGYGFGLGGTAPYCSIYGQSVASIGVLDGCHIMAINNYAAPFYQGEVGSGCYTVNDGTLCMCYILSGAENSCLQVPYVGFKAGCTNASGVGFCAVRVAMGGCCIGSGVCWFGFAAKVQCCCLNSGQSTANLATGIAVCNGALACFQHCCNMDTTNLMSPYGVARAATFGEALFAIKTCGGNTRYFSGYPGCRWHRSQSVCSCVNWEMLLINNPHPCEYPIKYLAFNPNPAVKKTYFLSRSPTIANCGIFEYKYADFTGVNDCTGTCLCSFQGTENQNAMFNRSNITDSPYIEKVSDFPSVFLANKYTTPLMCVGCLYRMSPKENPFWSITIYNHDTTEWDRFTTEDLLNWKSVAPDFRWDITNGLSYLTFDDCFRSSCNKFNDVVPKCGYFDFGVSANNYERTGVVISDGETIIVNNDTTEGLTAQVWGYEG